MEMAITGCDTAAGSTMLSIVIPALNEEHRLPVTLERLCTYLAQQPYMWEIIVVPNGCTDSTAGVARVAACDEPRIRVVEIDVRGKGLAAKAGALASTGDVVFLCDADLSMPPERLASFLEAIERADVVAGSREAGAARRFDEPWHRHIMGRIFNHLVRIMAVPGIDDTQCGFKAFRRDAALDLFGQQTVAGWGFDVELLYLARKYGYIVEELGIDWYFDRDTRVRPGVDTVQMIGELIAIRMNEIHGRYRSPGTTQPTPKEQVRD
jgi:dolichyl-phosphate beta-glucosyltransferase